MSRTKKVLMVQPESAGGNFEFALILRQGLLLLAAALKYWNESGKAEFLYEPWIWYEERNGLLNPAEDLKGFDIVMITALINEAPRAYQIAREAKECHPGIVTIGGGPHMSPLYGEAFREGGFDVIVEREGEDIIGPLCDVFMMHDPSTRRQYLEKVRGIYVEEDGRVKHIERLIKTIPADSVELPDYESILGLSKGTPVLGASLETVRGCTEKCTYCQVIQQFLGYRTVRPAIQLKRIEQIQRLVAGGLVHSSKGQSSTFLTDDLHIPPLDARKFRDFRLARLKEWKGRTEGINFTAQVRAEVAQDPEIMEAMLEARIRMLYIGVESKNDKNLKFVHKEQTADQVERDLVELRKRGFSLVGMTIIGLPDDTEDKIMEMADWITGLTDFQTMNWLTPLPATCNWTGLQPLDARGNILPTDEAGNVPGEYGLRPYQFYTGEQLVHYDERWTMAQSYSLGRRYYAKLRPVDDYYRRIFQASVRLNAGKWAEEVAAHFQGIISPDLVERMKQRLRTPTAERLSELWVQVAEATNTLYDTRVVKALRTLQTYQKLFMYTQLPRAETV